MTSTPFSKLLVANRGEIAVRILRSAQAAGLATVAVHSTVDADAPHVAMAGEAICIGGGQPSASYLSLPLLIEAAQRTGADAIHPGYGFLSENPAFAAACAEAGIVFVGPSAAAIRAMGDKAAAKVAMRAAGVPVVPGYDGEDQDETRMALEAGRIGWPLMIKAVAGGGGRGMRLVARPEDFVAALRSARSEARSAFGDDRVLLERAIVEPRHVEIQILADRHGNAIHLGERDCSVQRRHQKLIEEAPSPAVTPELRARMGEAAVRAALAIGYEGAGTLEFLLGADGAFHFMEMNTRLQVEHPVTEAVTGLDLVALQLDVAAGRPLPLRQEDVRLTGHAIEVRLCCEDPEAEFMPQSGRVALWEPAPGVRTDHALHSGMAISPHYDSMVAKIVAHGPDREAARLRLIRAVESTSVLGIRTNRAFLADCLRHPVFAAGAATTAFIAQERAALFPDRVRAEEQAAALVAAVLRAAPDAGLVHGFAAPVRLTRAGRDHAFRVTTGRLGHVRVADEADMALVEVEILDRSADRVRLLAQGRQFDLRLVVDRGRVWAQIDGLAWDFGEASFEPTVLDAGEGDGRVRAAMSGRVVSVDVAVGETVQRGQKLLVLEAMKMEHTHTSGLDGTVQAIHVGPGDQVGAFAVVVEVVAP